MQGFKKKMVGWWDQQPVFAKTYVAISVSLSILTTLELISAYHLFYTFQDTFVHVNLWRPITAIIFMGKMDCTLCFSMLVMYLALRNLQKIEIGRKQYPDFIWLIILIFGTCIIIGSIIDLYFFTEIFIMSVVIISSYLSKRISLFRVKMQTKDRKIILLIVAIIYGLLMAYVQKRYTTYIIGIILGSLYVFVKYELPNYIKKDFLHTPQWLQKWWLTRNRYTVVNNRDVSPGND